ncbi:unnamed protein product [Ectocarpus fasciculatus]
MSASKLSQNQRLGENVWTRMTKVNSELFTLTYGAMVMQLIRDLEDVNVVSQQLEKMGRNIGVRIIDEFLAKTGVSSCSNFRDTADMIAKVAFKMFLGITVEVVNWSADSNAFSLLLTDNPLVEFVELPVQYQELKYCNLLCGVIMGALEMVQLHVECKFVRDVLQGDDVSEMRVELKGILDTVMADEYKEN